MKKGQGTCDYSISSPVLQGKEKDEGVGKGDINLQTLAIRVDLRCTLGEKGRGECWGGPGKKKTEKI